MANPEKNFKLRGPIGALKARKQEAEKLAGSHPVAVLKEKVRLRDPNVLITVTRPRLNPFTGVKVEALWYISHEVLTIPTPVGPWSITIEKGESVEIAYPRKRKKGNHGVIVKFREGEKLIPSQAGPDDVNGVITAAVDNPLQIDRQYTPRSARSRRAI